MRGPDIQTVSVARKLRVNQTRAELLLWRRIRNRQLDGHKFVRQEPVEGFICDFVCRERRLIVEADGGQHNESQDDKLRDAALNGADFHILRFWNHDILQNIEGVLTIIQAELSKERPLTPTLSPQERGEGEAAQHRNVIPGRKQR